MSGELPCLRNGWAPILEVLPLLARLPGGLLTREAAVRTFLKGKWFWALPLLQSPSSDVVVAFRRALLNHTQCNWWCPGRFWADRVDLHPALSAAVGSAMFCLRFPEPPSEFLQAAINSHLAELNLQLASWDACRVTVRLRSVRDGLTRVLEPYVTWSDDAWTFTVDRKAGAHALRLAARYQCLLSVRRSRFDAEGITDVDIDASSHQTWRDWKATLDPKEKLLLSVFRGGAATSPTRRANMPFNNTSCPFCKAENASMRHFWALCPQFRSFRQEIEASFNVAHGWWVRQPRVTAKSGWITFDADPSPAVRAMLQVAACKLGLRIMSHLQCHDRFD